MNTWLVSSTTLGLLIGCFVLNVSAVWGEESGAQRKVREYYERKGAELAACKGDRACLDRVRGEQARARAQAMRDLMGPIDMPKFKYTTPKKSESLPPNRSQIRSEDTQGSFLSAQKKDEFDLGDLDF